MKLDKTLAGGFGGLPGGLKDLPTLKMKPHELHLPANLQSLAVTQVEPYSVPRRRPSQRQQAAIVAALASVLGILALYCLLPAPREGRAAAAVNAPGKAVREPAPSIAAKRDAKPAAGETPPSAAKATIAATTTPLEAARAFALGDDARAIERYRVLARQYPEQPAYTVLVGVLSARARER